MSINLLFFLKIPYFPFVITPKTSPSNMLFFLYILLSIPNVTDPQYEHLRNLKLINPDYDDDLQIDVLNDFVVKILQLLRGLHAQHKAHMDLRIENIQIRNLGDDLWTYELLDSEQDGFKLNEYAAPELIENDGTSFGATKVDLFAFGVILHKILQRIAGIGYQTNNRGYFISSSIGYPNAPSRKNSFNPGHLNPYGTLKKIALSLTECNPDGRPSAALLLLEYDVETESDDESFPEN
eukprot:NODE_147_length_15617_cov_0.576750.p11 type:complete len:238 gc:universal NODE_147_length_15617_cov_0.576750:2010-2723(+)